MPAVVMFLSQGVRRSDFFVVELEKPSILVGSICFLPRPCWFSYSLDVKYYIKSVRSAFTYAAHHFHASEQGPSPSLGHGEGVRTWWPLPPLPAEQNNSRAPG